eukprot:262425_1
MCDLMMLWLLNMIELTLSIWFAMFVFSFRDFDGRNIKWKYHAAFWGSILVILELWLIYYGLVGQIVANGKNWYRYAGHFSLLFTKLLFPNKWKQLRKDWEDAKPTILDSRYHTIRYLINLFILISMPNELFTNLRHSINNNFVTLVWCYVGLHLFAGWYRMLRSEEKVCCFKPRSN